MLTRHMSHDITVLGVDKARSGVLQGTRRAVTAGATSKSENRSSLIFVIGDISVIELGTAFWTSMVKLPAQVVATSHTYKNS